MDSIAGHRLRRLHIAPWHRRVDTSPAAPHSHENDHFTGGKCHGLLSYYGFYHGKLPTTAPSLSQFYYGQFFPPRSSHLSRTSANWGSECLRICNGQICNKWQPPSRKAPWKILESTWTISEFFSGYYITMVCSHAYWICWTSLADETIYKMSLTNDNSG